MDQHERPIVANESTIGLTFFLYQLDLINHILT